MPGTFTVQPGTVTRPAEKPYEPRGAALELLRSKSREVLLSGPAGTGKSRAALEKLNLVCMQMPIRAAIVRKTRASITQAAMVTMDSKVLPSPSGVRWHETDQEYRYPNGAKIVVAGLDNAERLGSTEFDLVYIQEATELESDDWGMLLRGLRNGVLGYQQLLADCNPAFPGHWLKQRCDEGVCQLIESHHEDNPTLWDPVTNDWTQFGRDYIRGLDALKGYQYQRLRLGLWVSAEGMYFEEWDPAVHVCEPFEIAPHWPRWLSVDYGFAAPWSVLYYTRDPESRRIYIYSEMYAANLRDEQQAAAIVAKTKDQRILLSVLDPSMFNPRTESMRPSIAQVYQSAGVPHIVPGMNNRKQGWAVVRRALAHDEHPPRLQVMRGRAPNLVRTIPTMVTDPLDPEDVADAVKGTKTEDHAVDSLRYGLVAEAHPPAPRRVKVQVGR